MRLKMVPQRVQAMDTRRVKPPAPAPKVADPFYSSAAWLELRDRVRREANGLCQRPGCTNVGRIVDHIRERQDGGADLDRNNVELLCTSCHATKTFAAKRARTGAVDGLPAVNHPEWLLPCAIPLLIVCGPPAAGKTAWARKQLAANGLLLDLDQIMAELSGLPLYEAGREWLNPAVRRRNRLLAQLTARRPTWPRAALIVSEPTAERREWWARKVRPTRVVVLETPEEVCLQRIADDPRRAVRREEMSIAVAKWWNAYTRRAGDVIVTVAGGGGSASEPWGPFSLAGAARSRNFSGTPESRRAR